MSRNLDSIRSRERSTNANLLLEICLVLNFVSVVTYSVRGIELHEENLELPLTVRRLPELHQIYRQQPNDGSFSLEQRSSRYYDENPQLFVNPKDDMFDDAIDVVDENPEYQDVSAGGHPILNKKDLPRLYRRNERHGIPRVYKKGGMPRLYKKTEMSRLYKRGGEYEKLNYNSIPRMYKKSSSTRDETFDDNEIPWLRSSRSGFFPRLYKKRSLGSFPRLYRKAESMRISRGMPPRLYKKSSFMKKMLPRLY